MITATQCFSAARRADLSVSLSRKTLLRLAVRFGPRTSLVLFLGSIVPPGTPLPNLNARRVGVRTQSLTAAQRIHIPYLLGPQSTV